mmetsp:Transcript_18497/g.55778  ORF Transcript_18497/g.55778 Transcript_18497/m.55778 type:complete len:199 (-) Transcript_18497:768-1364(-)
MHSHDSGATLHANVLLSVKGKLCPRAVVVGNLREGFARSCIPVMIMCRMVMAMTPVCILGVILSVQPTFLFGGEQRLNTLGVVIAIAQACVAATVKLVVRELRTSESSAVIIFTAGLYATVVSSLACAVVPGQWVTPRTWQQIVLLIATGLSAYIFQLFMTMGLRRVRAAPAAATAYLTVVWGMAAGILVSTHCSIRT